MASSLEELLKITATQEACIRFLMGVHVLDAQKQCVICDGRVDLQKASPRLRYKDTYFWACVGCSDLR